MFSSLHSISDQTKQNETSQLDQGLNHLFLFFLMFLFCLFGWMGRLKFSTPDICFFNSGFILLCTILKGEKMVAWISAASIGFLGYPSWKNSVFLRFYMHNLLFYSGHANKIGFFYMRWNIQSKKKQSEKWYFLGSQLPINKVESCYPDFCMLGIFSYFWYRYWKKKLWPTL